MRRRAGHRGNNPRRQPPPSCSSLKPSQKLATWERGELGPGVQSRDRDRSWRMVHAGSRAHRPALLPTCLLDALSACAPAVADTRIDPSSLPSVVTAKY